MPFWEHPHTKYKKNVHHFAVGLDSNFNIGKYQLDAIPWLQQSHIFTRKTPIRVVKIVKPTI
ncbi:hypothetical protein pdam_00024960 [Pocillopora damicornis]|uniref:Uncharacterized protein n=1 Tax=Pocillopora damicornis TaxID=46731 RepID=A0A3M6U7P7_POCDA|nr:hypothetical protein pdam_00024960 [Pocillopora damicornis]